MIESCFTHNIDTYVTGKYDKEFTECQQKGSTWHIIITIHSKMSIVQFESAFKIFSLIANV